MAVMGLTDQGPLLQRPDQAITRNPAVTALLTTPILAGVHAAADKVSRRREQLRKTELITVRPLIEHVRKLYTLRSYAGSEIVMSGTSSEVRAMMEPPEAEAERRDIPGREFLVACLRREFQQMPGVALTIEQVSRLFNVPLDTCHRVLPALAVEGQIEAREDGRFAGRRAA